MNLSPKQCGICLEEYNESERCPRTLNCFHTFCSDCIGNLISNNNKQCPFCRKGFRTMSIQKVMVNYAALDLIKYLSEQNVNAKPAEKTGFTSHSSKVEKMKKEALEDNKIQLKDCQEARQRMEEKIREIKDLECTIIQENKKIEKQILPKIQEVFIQNCKTLEELKPTRIQLEDQLKEIDNRQENLNDVQQKIQTAKADTFKDVCEILDESETLNASVSSRIEAIKIIISDEEKALAVKQKRVLKEREISNVLLDLLSTQEDNVENTDFNQMTVAEAIIEDHRLVETDIESAHTGDKKSQLKDTFRMLREMQRQLNPNQQQVRVRSTDSIQFVENNYRPQNARRSDY